MFNNAGAIPSNIIFSKEWFDTGKLNLALSTPVQQSIPFSETKTVVKTIDNNKDQLSKVTNQLELSELIANFDKLFPNDTWRSTEEKEAIMQSVNRGDIEISCKI